MANKQRYWFIDTHTAEEKLAIVEKGSLTSDGVTSNYQTVSESSKTVRIRGVFLDADLALNVMTGTFANIPSRFHDAIVSRVIALGYRDPRHMELDVSQFFNGEFEMGIKRAKKFSKGNYQTTGRVKAHDF